MRFRFFESDPPVRAGQPEPRVISVDGITPVGPNFSHWPGNRTAGDLVEDTSTGIALALAALDPAERARRLEGLDVVSNNHFDTDGVLSCYAVMHPEFALRHRASFLAAATSGDFQVHSTDAALAIDLTLTQLGSNEGPHGAELSRLSGAARGQRQYEICFDALPELMENPFARLDLVKAEYDADLADLAFARADARVETTSGSEFAVVHASREIRRLAVNTIAGAKAHVLVIVAAPDGWLYRHHERVESWFVMKSRPPMRRLPLAEIATELAALGPAPTDAAAPRWIAQPLTAPVPELFFGVEGFGRSFGPTTPGALRPCPLPPAVVIESIGRRAR